MLEIKHILFPTDHSACAERAFHHAAVLAHWHEARLHAVSVTEQRGESGPLLGDLRFSEEDIAEELRMTWGQISSERAQAGSGKAKLRLLTKQMQALSIPDALLRYAKDEAIDLIVMGTHGRRGVRRLVMGSVAEEVVRRAACPVLTVCTGQGEVPSRMVRRVLVPVDFSDSADTAVAYGVELAQTYGARIDLLHVVENATMPGAYGTEPLVVNTDLFEKRAYEALAKLAEEQIGFEDVRAAVEVGHPVSRIVDYAEAHETDLIVIPTHGRSGIERMLMGSVAEKVVRLAPCPVFTVKSFGKSLLPAKAASSSASAANA